MNPRDTTNSTIKCFLGNVRFYYCRMHPGGHFLFLRGRGGCHRNSRGYENVTGLSFKCNQCHENHFPKFKLHWFKLYPLIIDTQSWQFWSWSFMYMTNFQYIYIYVCVCVCVCVCLIYLWRKVVCFVLFCSYEIHQMGLLQIVFLVCLESSWSEGVHGLGAKVLEYWMIPPLKIKLN